MATTDNRTIEERVQRLEDKVNAIGAQQGDPGSGGSECWVAGTPGTNGIPHNECWYFDASKTAADDVSECWFKKAD
jgi:hypothetical protein